MPLTWTTIGTTSATMPGSIDVGLAVTSHVTTTPTLATGMFDHVTVTQP